MILAQILAHSINPQGIPLTSWLLQYNKSVHAELMTHRVFSRNAMSSRAVPTKESIRLITENPALPVRWGGHQKGMQQGEELTGEILAEAKHLDKHLREWALAVAAKADDLGVHKSIVNRWIDPWAHIQTIVTMTNPANWFALRAHSAAEPIVQVLAYRMLNEYIHTTPNFLDFGEWHIPFMDDQTRDLSIENKLRVATARCCWVSYGKPMKALTTLEDAFHRHDECIRAPHWSPLEHMAQVIDDKRPGKFTEGYPWSNFDINGVPSGWGQYRKLYKEENITAIDLQALYETRPTWVDTAGI